MRTSICLLLGLLILASFLPQDAYSQIIEKRKAIDNQTFDFKEYDQKKDPKKAFLLSAGITTGAILSGAILTNNGYETSGRILISGGIFIAPSAGNIYVGNSSGIFKGIGTRLLGASVAAIGAYWGLANIFSPESSDVGPALLLYGGLGLTAYSMIYDWINSANIAKKMNRSGSSFQVGPGYDTFSGKPTLSLKFSF